MKTVVVTGAAGFIGGYVVQEFVQRGWRVIAWVHRSGSAALQALQARGAVELVHGDLACPATVRQVFADLALRSGGGPDVLVHCAGRASDVGRRCAFRRANFEAVQNLVEVCRAGVRLHFVFISTTDVYGLRDFGGEAEAELPLQAVPANPYPHYKIAAEDWLRTQLPAERYSILRPAAVWGIGDPTLTARITAFLAWSPAIVHFGPWRGRNRWPLAHVRNVAMAAFLAATRPEAAGLAVNVLDSEHTSIDDFYRIVAALWFPGRAFASLYLPVWAGWGFAAAVTVVSNLLGLDRPCADPSLYALYTVSRNLDFSNARLRRLCDLAGCRLFSQQQAIAELKAHLQAGPNCAAR